jgi:membrane protease YdiL (CAAX protease family)
MRSLAKERPILTFLLLNFAWTWLFWLGAIPFRAGDDLLVTGLVLIGGYGPALAGVLTLGLKSDERFDLSPRRWAALGLAAALIFGVMALRYRVGNVPNYDTLAVDLTLSVPIVVAALIASLAGGWVISSALSRNTAVRDRMGTLLPWRRPSVWTLLAVVWYPAMILVAWGAAEILGMGVEYPALWGNSLSEVLPLYLLTFTLTLLAQGGNEEPGWRGFLQPELQKRFSPLVAALIVSLFWSLWHLPLYLNGFYGGDLVGGMIGGGIYRVLLSIFLAWFYNRSGGDIFAMVFLHTCFNVMVNFLPTSDLGLTVLWLIVVVVIVFRDKMYRKRPAGAGSA